MSKPYSRLTVNLTERSTEALRQAAELTGNTRTDTVNRALQFYAYIEQSKASGGGNLLLESKDGTVRMITVI